MSILVVGVSHRSAAVDLLERLALDGGRASKLRAAALDTAHVSEAVVLATCNRVEIYARVERFHGSVEDLTALLVESAGLPDASGIVPALYVHYDAGAVAHLFSVATGLESMVVGEGQILGQVRDALRVAQDEETVGPALNSLFQHALRVGKRAHTETRIDRAGRSVVSVALEQASAVIGDLSRARVCIVGAGSVAALTASLLRRAGAVDIVVSSRTLEHARRVAVSCAGRAVELSALPAELAEADLLISCTGSAGIVVDAAVIAAARQPRTDPPPLAVVDLALPHDVDPAAADLPGVTVIGLPDVAARVAAGDGIVAAESDVRAVEAIVAAEVEAFATARAEDRVAPTVVALRTMATGVVAAELDRLWSRLPELTERQRREIAWSLHRQADKLLHEPTVRIKQFAGRVPESSYAAALAELFALDPSAVDAVSGRRDDL